MVMATLWLDGSLRLGDTQFSARRTLALLDAIDEARSIRVAAEKLTLSYRAVWGRLGALQDAFGRPLVTKTKGHGSTLTPTGRALRDALRSAATRLDDVLAEEGRRLQDRLADLTGDAPRRYRIACSHDPRLVAVLAGLDGVEVSVVGSHEALERLRSGRADAAGFHLCPRADGHEAVPDLGEALVRPLFRREQGLLVAAGNPLRITAMTDLARPDVAFINRQRGSGTRDWTDWLLARERVPAEAVRGYDTEEFTHHAVAATVAAGMASAGIGVRAAADRFGLDFLPLAEETYFLATRRGDASPALKALLDAFPGP
jgi:putative molybdopterin biosynthesis protein